MSMGIFAEIYRSDFGNLPTDNPEQEIPTGLCKYIMLILSELAEGQGYCKTTIDRIASISLVPGQDIYLVLLTLRDSGYIAMTIDAGTLAVEITINLDKFTNPDPVMLARGK